MQAGTANSRHEARERALQVLYAVEIGGHDPLDACYELIAPGEQRYLDFARDLVILACHHRERLEHLISDKVQRWDLERIALMDRLILRIALTELLHVPDIPPKVTINEAIEIAKEYSTDQSGRFVNGILDAICAEYETEIRNVKKSVRGKKKKKKQKQDGESAATGQKEPFRKSSLKE